jgi:hypothetical protein
LLRRARGEIKAGERFTIGLYAVNRSLVDAIRLRYREGRDVAWDLSLVTPQGAKPAALIKDTLAGRRYLAFQREVRNAPDD